VAIGALMPLLAIACWPAVRALDARAGRPSPALELLAQLPVFADVPRTALERLARLATQLQVPGGETIVAQGEPGDRFYAISSGVVEVSIDGHHVRQLTAGDSFGEIALLRDVPRTATVRSLGAADLLAIERDDFVLAVTGAAATSAAAADGVVAGSLVFTLPAELRRTASAVVTISETPQIGRRHTRQEQ
jgi:CRP-like cAMP-binding protein